MIIKPKIKGFICVNAHPQGCEKFVNNQIDHITSNINKKVPNNRPKKVLIIGCSSGYGLASRIALAFTYQADTLGVYFDREPTEKKTASSGWYNNKSFESKAKDQGLIAQSLNMDAFQDSAKQDTIKLIKETLKQVDLVVYSLASPRRFVERENKTYSSVLKPVGECFQGKTLNTDKQTVTDIQLDAATKNEIDATVKVMGGDDWQQWMHALDDAGVLAENCKTIAYTYIGKELTKPIYGDATIGKAKEDLDRAALEINKQLNRSQKKSAYIGVLKAMVTQSSSAIPVMPLYISLLYKVMKENNVHENCIEQVARLITTGLYGDACQIDNEGRLRVDDLELADTIQNEVKRRWQIINTQNLNELADFNGYRNDFLQLFGFGFEHINYDEHVNSKPLPVCEDHILEGV